MVTSTFYNLPDTGLFKAVGERLTEAQVTGTPVPDTAATANVTFTYFSATHTLFVKGSFASLQGTLLTGGAADAEGNAAAGFDISLAAAGSTGALVRNLDVVSTGAGRGNFSGVYQLTAAEEAAYVAGDLYVTARTTARPDGELRGQIDSVVAATLVASLDQPMTPEEVAPPIKTPEDPGTGIASAYYDTVSNALVVRGSYSDLSSALVVRGETDPEGNVATAIHLHSAEVGDNGGVERNLMPQEGANNSGTFGGNYTLRANEEINFLNGESYTFIHTVKNFGGELRGQVDDFVTFTPYAGTAGNDIKTGDATSDIMLGYAGNDQLTGGVGDDVLDGGTGADTLTGGTGNDAYVVDSAGDIVAEAAGEGTDTVQSSIDYRLGSQVEQLILTGSAVVGTGNNLANAITGNAAANRLSGGAGEDTLRGGDGDDNLAGGSGADLLVGGEGNDLYTVDDLGDVVVETGSSTGDRVMASVSFTLSDGVDMLTLMGGATAGTGNTLANRITGNAIGNSLAGGAGDDTIFAGAGDDTLLGGMGLDRLFGEAGADRFRFSTAAEANDVISGFVSGTDGLQVSAAGFGGGLAVGALDADQFVVATNGRATEAHGQFIYDGARTLWWDADGTGAGARHTVAILTESTTLLASDLTVIA